MRRGKLDLADKPIRLGSTAEMTAKITRPSGQKGGRSVDGGGADTPALVRNVALYRVAFGLIWAIDALFKWRPTFMNTYLQQVVAAGQGQPAWIGWLYTTAEHVVAVDPKGFAILTAVVESATALGLILGFARRIGYLVGLGFSLMVWVLGEGFGGPYTAGSTDIGTGIIYAVVFAGLYGLDRACGPSSYSLDWVIQRRWPAWRTVAEAARPSDGQSQAGGGVPT